MHIGQINFGLLRLRQLYLSTVEPPRNSSFHFHVIARNFHVMGAPRMLVGYP